MFDDGVSELNGGSFAEGMSVAAINKLVIAELGKMKDGEGKSLFTGAELRWISATVGATVSKAVGGNAGQGAGIADSATRNNELKTIEEIKKEMLAEGRAEEYLKLSGEAATPENVSALNKAVDDYITYYKRDVDCIAVSGSGGVGVVSAQQVVIYDAITKEKYVVSGASLGLGLEPGASLSVSGIKLLSLDPTIDLQDHGIRRAILGGPGIGGSAYIGVGGGVSTPIGEYQNRVYIVAVGAGTPQGSIDLSHSKNAEERAQEILNDVLKGNVYGKD